MVHLSESPDAEKFRFDGLVAEINSPSSSDRFFEFHWLTVRPASEGSVALDVAWFTDRYPGATVEIRPLRAVPKFGPIPIATRKLSSGEKTLGVLVPEGDSTELEWEDVSTFEALPDDRFWEVIGHNRRPVRQILRELRSNDDLASSFKVALDEKLHALDHPDNAVRMKVRGQEVVSDDASLAWRCAVIAEGREAFEAAVELPGSFRGLGKNFRAEPLLLVAGRARSRPGHRKFLVSGTPIDTGSNVANWGAPKESSTPTKSAREHWASSLRGRALALGASPDSDPWFDVDGQSDWYAVHLLRKRGVDCEESLEMHAKPKLAMQPDADKTAADIAEIRRRLESDEGVDVLGVQPSAPPERLNPIACFAAPNPG